MTAFLGALAFAAFVLAQVAAVVALDRKRMYRRSRIHDGAHHEPAGQPDLTPPWPARPDSTRTTL